MHRSSLSPELRALILLARSSHDSVHAEIEQLLGRASMERVAALCFANNVFPSALRGLRGFTGTEVTKARALMQRKFVTAWLPFRDQLLNGQEQVEAILESASVSYVLLRGLSLAERVYKHPCERICSDIDVLIRSDSRAIAEEVLLDHGFAYRRAEIFRLAQREVVKQVEFQCPNSDVVADVNWALTENAGIGTVHQDEDCLWNRATPSSSFRFELSREDYVLHLIRHVGHGHDFRTGLLRACMDVAGVCDDATTLDMDYLRSQLHVCEATTIAARFANFFDCVYRDDTMPPVTENFSAPKSADPFCRRVLVPSLETGVRHRSLIVDRNLAMVSKFWNLDRVSRVAKLLKQFAFPPEPIVRLLGPKKPGTRIWLAYAGLYCRFVLVLPGVILGMFCFVCQLAFARVE